MKISLLGTDFNSGNRGCGALGYAAVDIMKKMCEKNGDSLELYAVLFAPEPVPRMDSDIKLHCIKIEPKKPGYWKKCAKIFKECDLILDFTGGDSFSDMYGLKRFCIASLLKEFAIKSRAKFVMAPQTIGPFQRRFARNWAKRIMRKCDMAFARDTMSQEYAQKTFGIKPFLTTDVAFSLPYSKQEKASQDKIKVGFNPSGLLWDGTKEFCASKHITVDYKEYVNKVLGALCKDDRYEVHLIPHVFSQDGVGMENDMRACMEIQKDFPKTVIERSFDTPMEVKGCIATMDVFIGARMHATIAAASTGVATIPFSYSRKFEGLYHDLGYEYLISATCMETKEAIEKTLDWINDYKRLQEKVETAKQIAEEKLTEYMEELERVVDR